MTLAMLGIPNCDTIKKARKYLEEKGVDFHFRDLRKEPLSSDEWQALIDADNEGKLINSRSPTLRKMGISKADLADKGTCLKALTENPAVMKRPTMTQNGQLLCIGLDVLKERF